MSDNGDESFQAADMELLAAVLDNNSRRLDSGRMWSATLFCLIFSAMVAQTAVLALLLAWFASPAAFAAFPRPWDGRQRATNAFAALVALQCVVLAASGFNGWFVLTSLYALGMIGLAGAMAAVSISAARDKRGREKVRGEPPGNDVTVELLTNDGASQQGQQPAQARGLEERIRAMYHFYDPPKLANVGRVMSSIERGRDEVVMDALVKKYGPEPPVPPSGCPTAAFLHAFYTAVEEQQHGNRGNPASGDAHGDDDPAASQRADVAARVASTYAQFAGNEGYMFLALRRKYGGNADLAVLLQGKEAEEVEGWSRWPHAPGRRQLISILGATFIMLLCLSVIMCLLFLWTSADHYVVERHDQIAFQPLSRIAEVQPQVATNTQMLLYAWSGLARDLQLALSMRFTTDYCGRHYGKTLSASERRTELLNGWIEPLRVNMSSFDPPSYAEYETVNAWLTRRFAPGQRPVDMPGNPAVVVSPVDGRMLIFLSVRIATRLWVKGSDMTTEELLNFAPVAGDPHYFQLGTVVIARLAPQDYHRFHAPVAGMVVHVEDVDGTQWSTGVQGAQSGNYVFYNRRLVIVLDAGPALQHVAVVAIGTTCIGSVLAERDDGSPLRVGSAVAKGEQLGLFQFGGSTVVTLFKRGAFVPDCDVYAASAFPVEMFVHVRRRIGIAVGGDGLDDLGVPCTTQRHWN